MIRLTIDDGPARLVTASTCQLIPAILITGLVSPVGIVRVIQRWPDWFRFEPIPGLPGGTGLARAAAGRPMTVRMSLGSEPRTQHNRSAGFCDLPTPESQRRASRLWPAGDRQGRSAGPGLGCRESFRIGRFYAPHARVTRH